MTFSVRYPSSLHQVVCDIAQANLTQPLDCRQSVLVPAIRLVVPVKELVHHLLRDVSPFRRPIRHLLIHFGRRLIQERPNPSTSRVQNARVKFHTFSLKANSPSVV